MNHDAVSDGWSRDKENPHMRSKKYDPHAETRKKAYEVEQKDHHRRRMEKLKVGGGGGVKPRTNNASTFEDRRKAVLEKKEKIRKEKIAKAKKSSDMVAKRLARKEAMEREKQLKGKEAYDVSEAREGQVLELGAPASRVNPSVKRGETSSECATCRSTKNLEEDCDNKGIYYCRKCWEEWE